MSGSAYLRDPFVLESNQSGHPSSVSGDRIARCKRWIEREILKPSRLLIAFSMMFFQCQAKTELLRFTRLKRYQIYLDEVSVLKSADLFGNPRENLC